MERLLFSWDEYVQARRSCWGRVVWAGLRGGTSSGTTISLVHSSSNLSTGWNHSSIRLSPPAHPLCSMPEADRTRETAYIHPPPPASPPGLASRRVAKHTALRQEWSHASHRSQKANSTKVYGSEADQSALYHNHSGRAHHRKRSRPSMSSSPTSTGASPSAR